MEKKHTCVGLAIELVKQWRRLDKGFKGLGRALSIYSCEEKVENGGEYVNKAEPELVEGAEKEHVMAGIHIEVDGRAGVLLADPGYHVPRVLTVMEDGVYPHTGWFTQSDEPHSRKEYHYAFNAHHHGYVEWRERDTRGPLVVSQTSLIYVARPYLTGVNVTERRNLVYNFKSLLSRDQKGHVTAGIYFPVGARGKDAQFTLFLDDGTSKQKTKFKFSAFLRRDEVPEAIEDQIEQCNKQMNYKYGNLLNTICRAARVMTDDSFIQQLLEINDDIAAVSL
ncbi:hypothetical protein JYU34_001459 [Plutella xylostella]|uniref:Uncharacterized protein n=1 Tax=Plutella xylostella TaxID=51655 RepID=A0ABQ7R3Y9_PLUXY|nr:hypothetical protein JYU34_001459 [Plutella xylostella]